MQKYLFYFEYKFCPRPQAAQEAPQLPQTFLRKNGKPSIWRFTIIIFEQIIPRGLLGSLAASLHVYEKVYPSISPSLHRFVCHATVNVFQQVKERESQEESRVVTSSHNHFIIMRTHRWPYGPCLDVSASL